MLTRFSLPSIFHVTVLFMMLTSIACGGSGEEESQLVDAGATITPVGEESVCAPSAAPDPCMCSDGSMGTHVCTGDGGMTPCDCSGGPDGGVAEEDGISSEEGTEEGELTYGDRECLYTVRSYAAGRWSPASTETLTFNVAEVEGGFAVSGYGEDSPFASCEVVFDLEGSTATFRDPQPCQDGIAQYQEGVALVVFPDFSFDVLGTAFGGMPISLKVDCGAGPVSIPEEEEPTEGFLGNWTCSGTSGAMPVNFTLNNTSTGTDAFESTFEPAGEMDFLIGTLMNCKVMWLQEGDNQANIDPESYCAGGAETSVLSDTGMSLSNGTLTGSFYTFALERVQATYDFTCQR